MLIERRAWYPNGSHHHPRRARRLVQKPGIHIRCPCGPVHFGQRAFIEGAPARQARGGARQPRAHRMADGAVRPPCANRARDERAEQDRGLLLIGGRIPGCIERRLGNERRFKKAGLEKSARPLPHLPAHFSRLRPPAFIASPGPLLVARLLLPDANFQVTCHGKNLY